VPRQARLDAPGTLHHVIIRGIEQRQIVDDDEDWKNFVDRMGSLGLQTEPAIYAWALMQIGTNPRVPGLRRTLLGPHVVIASIREITDPEGFVVNDLYLRARGQHVEVTEGLPPRAGNAIEGRAFDLENMNPTDEV